MNTLLEKCMEAGVYRLASRILEKTDVSSDMLNLIVTKTINELQKELEEPKILDKPEIKKSDKYLRPTNKKDTNER